MYDPTHYFSTSYAQAKSRFLAAVTGHGASSESLVLPDRLGAQGEPLSTDVALIGSAQAARLLVLSSGTHGVEGFCGAGCQLAVLDDAELLGLARQHEVALLFIHAINPHGFSHRRRWNEDNVDVNRNFVDFSKPRARNVNYAALHPLLIPEVWPPTAENEEAIGRFIAQQGMAAFQAAISGGQYEFADGLFYGGSAPSWSSLTLRRIFACHAAQATRIGWLDYHTGLGAYGHCEKIAPGSNPRSARRARRWWGMDVVGIAGDDCVSSEVLGSSDLALSEVAGKAACANIAMEYGVTPLATTAYALRAEQWLCNHPSGASAAQAEAIKQGLLDSFYSTNPVWQGSVLGQSRTALVQAIRGLALDD